MGNKALKDLDLAGVQWELTETALVCNTKKAPVQQNFSSVANRLEQKNIIPASAPITLSTIKSMVERPNDIASLVRMVAEFNHPLRNGATQVVMPNIAKESNGLIIITDMPSTADDLSGNILSGEAGEMIDKMLSAIGMSRDTVSIIPLVFWRTPGGRTPTREEIDLAFPFVDKMINMLKPKIILTLGTLAATEIAKTNLTTEHGKEIESDNGYKIIPIYHPNYLMLKPSAKKDVWSVLQNIQNMLKNQ